VRTAVGETSSTRVTVVTLTTIVVGSMVGAGVFSLPQRFAEETGVYGALIAWTVAGTGMLMLAFVFQNLAVRKPHLDAGVYAYANAGFGEYLGFFSAFGYWASACVGNVTYWVLIMSTVGALVPALGDGGTVPAVAASSVGLWVFFLLVRRGVREAASLNRVVTFAKVVANLRGADFSGSLFDQVRGTMLVTVFVFLGVEGASVYSRHARRRQDVGRATVLGFLSVFAVFASVTIVSYGILPMDELAQLRQPSMAGVLEAAVGGWGSAFVSVGLVVSVLGAYLAWTLMAAEVLFVSAKDDDMPRFLKATNAKDVPVRALLMTALLAQVFLVVTLFSENAFDFALDLTSVLALVPYFFAALYGFRLVLARESYEGRERTWRRDLAVGALATVYTAFLLFAAGTTYLLVSFVVYAPATILFVMARREQGRRLFSPREVVILVVSLAGAVVGVVALAAGWVHL
jgi:arginine:ornithine antiporter/lysine permease